MQSSSSAFSIKVKSGKKLRVSKLIPAPTFFRADFMVSMISAGQAVGLERKFQEWWQLSCWARCVVKPVEVGFAVVSYRRDGQARCGPKNVCVRCNLG